MTAYFPPSGSVVTFQTDPTKFVGTVSVVSHSPQSVATLQGTNPWIISNTSVTAFAGGLQITSVMNTIPSSMLVGASIIGLTPVAPTPSSVWAFQGTSPWVMNSVITTVQASVAAAVINFTASVAANINVISASIIANQGTNPWVINSIIGTFAEDAPHTPLDKGLFIMQVRNDTMSSVTSADGDYSQISGGPVGETVIANAPINKWVRGSVSILTSATLLQPVIAAPGASIFTYITSAQIANWSNNGSVLVALQGTAPLVIAAIPVNNTISLRFTNPLKTLANVAFSASIRAGSVSSIFVSAQGFTSKFDV